MLVHILTGFNRGDGMALWLPNRDLGMALWLPYRDLKKIRSKKYDIFFILNISDILPPIMLNGDYWCETTGKRRVSYGEFGDMYEYRNKS